MLEVNLKNRAISQTTQNFNSMCRFGDAYLGATSSGLFSIGGYNDNLVKIPALISRMMLNRLTPPRRLSGCLSASTLLVRFGSGRSRRTISLHSMK